jgi:tetratricopeptide (TPR) repeat protein
MLRPVKKRNLLLLLGVVAVAGGALAAEPPKASEPADADPMKEALRTGATAAQIFLSYLKPNATTEFPGTLAWVYGAGATIEGLDKENPTDAWRSLDPDQLITHNAAWWEAYYEVAPGDPGLALLHGSTLLCAGDAQRAMQVLRLALNHEDLDEGSARIIISVMQHAGAYMEPSHALVRDGLVLHDKHDYLGAIAKYDAALKIWPRNAWALYEKGLSVRMHERKDDLPPLVVSLFARSRAVDPFQWSAWQGTVKDIPGLKEMHGFVRPLWEKSLKDLNYRMNDDELTKLADTLQLAGVDDLALVTRQILIQHRGRYAPADHPFIAKSLRRLVPGDRTEATLSRLASSSFKAIRLYEPLEKKDDKEASLNK